MAKRADDQTAPLSKQEVNTVWCMCSSPVFFFILFFCFVFLFWAAPHLGCCLPLTCQFAVKLLQEAGLSGEKSKADWVGTRLMVDLWLCGGGRKKKEMK